MQIFGVIYFRAFCALLILWLSGCAGKDALQGRYASSVECSAQLIEKGDSQQVLLELYLPRPDLSGIQLRYEVRAAYQSPLIVRRDSVALGTGNVQKQEDFFLIRFSLLSTQLNEAVMFLYIHDRLKNTLTIRDIPLGRQAWKTTSLSLFKPGSNHALLYVHKNDTVQFRDLSSGAVYVYRLREDFNPASPPMQLSNTANQPELLPDSAFQVFTDSPFVLGTQSLYFAQTDTGSHAGLGFRVVDSYYPKYKTAEQLTEPLIYISTPEELAQLRQAKEKKAALDNYWLQLSGGDQDKARGKIRLFYQRVEYANKSFTTYKEGWKSDMGMIYIVFGAPSEIQKTTGGQEWIYRSSNTGVVKFAFVKKQNQFSRQHYELVRNARYRDIWYQTVEQWRYGSIE